MHGLSIPGSAPKDDRQGQKEFPARLEELHKSPPLQEGQDARRPPLDGQEPWGSRRAVQSTDEEDVQVASLLPQFPRLRFAPNR